MSIEVKGLKENVFKLKNLENKLTGAELHKKLLTIGAMVKSEIEFSFENEKSPFGEKWKPISANTAFVYAGGKSKAYTKNKKRQRAGFLQSYGTKGSKKILFQSGSLANRWQVLTNANAVSISNNTSSNGFPYGLTHQFGTKNAFGKGINIPARPFLPIDSKNDLEPKLKANILHYLEDSFQA